MLRHGPVPVGTYGGQAMSQGQGPGPAHAPRGDALLHLAAIVVIVFGLQAARVWLLPVCFALLLAVLGAVPMRLLRRIGLPRPLAAIVAALLLGVAFVLVLRGLLVSLADFGAALPQYEGRMTALLADVVAFLGSIGLHVDARELVASIEPRTWLGVVQQSVGGVLSLFSAVLLTGFALVLLLWEGEHLVQRLRSAFGAAFDERRFSTMVGDLQRYVGVKTATSALTGVCVYLLNVLSGVQFAALWGLLAFLLNYIPIIGSILAAVPAVFLALVVPELGWSTAVGLTIGYLVINNLISNLLEPVLMGRELGLPAIAVLLSLLFWGWLWGAGGMFLAVPLTVVFGTMVSGRRDLSLLRALIGRDPY